ncbi:DNA/RNA non-specific endonuclease [Celerinatantimonas sp. YJH-8]|uniref:DNA/RNA non-specific endonuclease n=1 Tax=Celerinatantimonas sp. YJH-8 TaxID=3228714 RepID=UPI0038C4596C
MAEPTEAVWSEAQVMVDELAAKSEQQKKAPPTSTVVEKFADNEAVWTLDEKGRPLSVEATLKSVQKTERSKEEIKAQGSVGGSSRLEDDDGGHLIGHRFMSDQGLKNLFPQNANLNRSAYKKMENELADWTKEGCQVKLKVVLSPPGAERPKEITAYYEAKNPDTGKIVFRRRHNFNNMSGESFERVKRKDMKYYKG